jgi:hypothetical protein
MAKRKRSTFERLRNGKLPCNRKQRRELEHRLNSADPGLEIIHPHAAGIDGGNESHHVAVPAGRDARPVRETQSRLIASRASMKFPGRRLLGSLGCPLLRNGRYTSS